MKKMQSVFIFLLFAVSVIGQEMPVQPSSISIGHERPVLRSSIAIGRETIAIGQEMPVQPSSISIGKHAERATTTGTSKLYEQYPSEPPETTLKAPDWLGSFDSYAYTMPGIFLSGVADGFNQTLLFHYDKFKVRFPGAKDQFWDPAISWENKYAQAPDGATLTDYEAFPFSTSLLVWTTDGHHLTRAADHFLIYGTVAVNFGEKKNWKRILIDGAAHFVVRSIAFNLTYNTLKK